MYELVLFDELETLVLLELTPVDQLNADHQHRSTDKLEYNFMSKFIFMNAFCGALE